MTQCPASPMTPNVIDSTESECEQCPPPLKKQKKDTPSLPKGMTSWIMDLTTDDGEGATTDDRTTKAPVPPWRLSQPAAPPPPKKQSTAATAVATPLAPPPAPYPPLVWPTEENRASTEWFSSRLNSMARHAFMDLYPRDQRRLVRECAHDLESLRGNLNTFVLSWSWRQVHSGEGGRLA